jgi:hypothetical protein
MRVPVTISASALLRLIEECRVEVWLCCAESAWGSYIKSIVSTFAHFKRETSITSRNRAQLTHSAHHSHISAHTHHATSHAHHISCHGHIHRAHVVHAHAAASSATVLHSTSSHTTVHHAATVEAAASKVVHRSHGIATEVIHGRWCTISSHSTAHVSSGRIREIPVLETHIAVSTTVVEIAPIIVEAVIVPGLLAALVAAISTRWRTLTAIVLFARWDIFREGLEGVDVGWVEDGCWLLGVRLVFVECI